MYGAINFNHHLNYIKNNSTDISFSLFKCCLALHFGFDFWILVQIEMKVNVREKANQFILFFRGSIQRKQHNLFIFILYFHMTGFISQTIEIPLCVCACCFPNSIRFTCTKCQNVWIAESMYEHTNCVSFCDCHLECEKSLCKYICVKLFASNWKTLVFSPPKTGWFIYSQRCSRYSRLMESIQFSIGVGGSGQILHHLGGSMNVMASLCMHGAHTHTHYAIQHWTHNKTQTTTTLYIYIQLLW